MKRILNVLLVVAAMSAFASLASANTWTPRVDRREARQHARIHAGVRSGNLTRREVARLRMGQRHVHRMEMRAKADGRVGPRERARITRAQNHESRVIRRLKHNARVRHV